jgi:hypothetical protein
MCFFDELNKQIENFINKNNYNENIDNDIIYDAESDIIDIYYSKEKIFEKELENIFNNYFSKYEQYSFEVLLINIYNIYLLNNIKINNYYCSTFNIKNINIED